MAIPRIVNDGDFRIAHVCGSPEWTTPFADRGDAISFELMVKYRVDQAYYVRGSAMQKILTRKGYAYLVDESEARDIGLGLLEFTRTYASVPRTRYEGSSYAYEYQFYSESASYDWATPPATPTIESIVAAANATVKYEYFLNRPGVQIAPRVATLFGSLVRFANWGQIVAGQSVLAEDSTVEIYKAGIYVRRGIYIVWPQIKTN